MHAVEDFLFGIPIQSPYAFLHPYGDLRVGAVMASGDERLELRRRKGSKDTLIDPDGLPVPTAEAALARLLGGAERGFFLRMFGLSHERLAEGGRGDRCRRRRDRADALLRRVRSARPSGTEEAA